MNLLIICDQNLDDRNIQRLGLDVWLEKGWTVRVWNMTPINEPSSFKEIAKKNSSLANKFNYVEVGSYGELFSNLMDLKRSKGVIIDFGGIYISSLICKIYSKLKGYRILMCDISSIPDLEVPEGKLNVFKHRLKAIKRVGFFGFFGRLFLLTLRFLNPRVDYAVTSGLAVPKALSKARVKIGAHTLDYETFMSIRDKKTKRFVRSKYLVFIDQDLPQHPDFLFSREAKHPVTPKVYYSSLVNFLNELSTVTGLKVVISIHPRGNLEKSKQYFPNFRVTKGNTGNLIKDSHLVVTHFSVAISFAILFRKPLLFVSSNEMIKSIHNNQIKRLALLLDQKIYNIDEVKELYEHSNILLSINPKCQSFQELYIKNPVNPDIALWPRVVDKINEDIIR